MNRTDQFAAHLSGVLLGESLARAKTNGTKVDANEMRTIANVAYSFAEIAEAVATQRELNRNTLASIGAAKLAEDQKKKEEAAEASSPKPAPAKKKTKAA